MDGNDILFFDDLDDFLTDESAEDVGDAGELHQEDLLESVEYFRKLFSEEILNESEIHSSAAAIILYQHLTNMGFQSQIDAGDTSTRVIAKGGHNDDLLGHVQYLLESLTSLNKSDQLGSQTGSTIRSVNLHFEEEYLNATITFISV